MIGGPSKITRSIVGPDPVDMVDGRLVLRVCMERLRHYLVRLEKLSAYTYNIIPTLFFKTTWSIRIPVIRVVRPLDTIKYQSILSDKHPKNRVLDSHCTA